MSDAATTALDNPLLKPWQTPFETPPFADIAPEHFLPAFERAFADHSAEITVTTLGQMIWRAPAGEGWAFMSRGSCCGRNLSEKALRFKA